MSKKMHRSSIITAGFTVLLLSLIIIHFSLPAMSDGGVNFHADVTSGNAPLTVKFTDDYTGSSSSYYWSFGDGSDITKNPSHTYKNPGTYDVSFTVYTTIGNGSPTTIGTEVKKGYITVTDPKPSTPTADFTMSPTNGTAPLTVKFKGLSSGGTLSYDWDFGDGTQHSAEINPTHNYAAVGNYTVKLKVSNPGGSNIKSYTITVTAPVATAQDSNSDGNNSSIAAGALGASVTAVPAMGSAYSTVAAVAPQSNGGLMTLSISEDMIQIILTALIAIVIAFMIIYYFSSLSKREEKKQVKKTPAGRNMLKSRMPVIGQKATDGIAPKPETAKLPEMPAMPVDPIRQQDVVSAPEPVKPPVVVRAPEAVKVPEPVKPPVMVKTVEIIKPRNIEILPEELPAPVKPARAPEPVKPPVVVRAPEPVIVPEPAKPPAAVKAPETVKVPEPASPYARPAAKPPVAAKQMPPTAEPVSPPVETPAIAKPPEPKKQPSKLSDLLKSKAKEDSKTSPPEAKPVKPARRRNEVDKDYLYGLVMGETPETEDKDKK